MRRIRNPPQRFERLALEWEVEPPEARLEVYEDATRKILAHNDSPDLGFNWSLNPYRGCTHGCAYCYARPSHEYLGFGAGTDFETRIVVKPRAPELLRDALTRPGWKGEVIALSGDTDAYQPLEAHYKLTRQCLEVCLELENPVSIVTKSYLITRDKDLLAEMAQKDLVHVAFGISILDDEASRKLEPGAPRPAKRFEAMATLSACGVPTELLVAPLIPGLSDSDFPELLRRAKDAGAEAVSYALLRLPGSVAEVFLTRLEESLPLRAKRIESLQRQARAGKLNDSRYGYRLRGSGPYWEAIRGAFRLEAKRLGLGRGHAGEEPAPLKPRPPNAQLSLFDDT